jgi:hypothetical protein
MVRSHNVQAPESPDILYCRFLFCKSFEAIREMTLGDLFNVPITKLLLVTSLVRAFQKLIVDAHPVEELRQKLRWRPTLS